jgi:hypothetical protein
MQNHKVVYIYLLIDPNTGDIRYVGATIRPKKRLDEHLRNKDKSHRTNWITSLKNKQTALLMIAMEQVNTGDK